MDFDLPLVEVVGAEGEEGEEDEGDEGDEEIEVAGEGRTACHPVDPVCVLVIFLT